MLIDCSLIVKEAILQNLYHALNCSLTQPVLSNESKSFLLEHLMGLELKPDTHLPIHI